MQVLNELARIVVSFADLTGPGYTSRLHPFHEDTVLYLVLQQHPGANTPVWDCIEGPCSHWSAFANLCRERATRVVRQELINCGRLVTPEAYLADWRAAARNATPAQQLAEQGWRPFLQMHAPESAMQDPATHGRAAVLETAREYFVPGRGLVTWRIPLDTREGLHAASAVHGLGGLDHRFRLAHPDQVHLLATGFRPHQLAVPRAPVLSQYTPDLFEEAA